MSAQFDSSHFLKFACRFQFKREETPVGLTQQRLVRVSRTAAILHSERAKALVDMLNKIIRHLIAD
jgi:hypothetical protein